MKKRHSFLWFANERTGCKVCITKVPPTHEWFDTANNQVLTGNTTSQVH